MSCKIFAPAVVAALALTGVAHAQPPGPPPPAEMQAMREAHARQRAADLKTVLRLRADQESALNAFLAAEGPPPPPKDRPPGPPKPMTTPERLDEMGRRDAERASFENRRSTALRTFYAALSPDQQQVFDALQRLQGPRGPGGPFGGRRGGPPGGFPRGPFGPGGPGAPSGEPPH